MFTFCTSSLQFFFEWSHCTREWRKCNISLKRDSFKEMFPKSASTLNSQDSCIWILQTRRLAKGSEQLDQLGRTSGQSGLVSCYCFFCFLCHCEMPTTHHHTMLYSIHIVTLHIVNIVYCMCLMHICLNVVFQMEVEVAWFCRLGKQEDHDGTCGRLDWSLMSPSLYIDSVYLRRVLNQRRRQRWWLSALPSQRKLLRLHLFRALGMLTAPRIIQG